MKKLIATILAFAMVMALAACGLMEEKSVETTMATETEPSTTIAAVEEEPFAILEAKNCFYDAGFVELISGAESAAAYTFAAEDSEGVTWSVYVLEEAFEEGFRYIRQIAEPVLVGDGRISVEEGQFVYVYCSANEFTTGEINENAKLNITVK